MIDIETFGNGNRACIVQIGACYFDLESGEIGETFKLNIDARTSVKAGGEIDADTVYWWLSQSREAIDSVIATPQIDIYSAFKDLNVFLGNAKEIWSHATFDFVIISDMYRKLGIKPSFRYTAARDIHTLMSLSGLKVTTTKREGVHHDGLADAIFQVAYCVEAYKHLKGQNHDS